MSILKSVFYAAGGILSLGGMLWALHESGIIYVGGLVVAAAGDIMHMIAVFIADTLRGD